MTAMRAVAFERFGGPDVLHIAELPRPVAKSGEVVVRVAASTVNPTDLLMRSGQQAALMSASKPPFIAGMEFAGHIHQVGDGTTSLRVGQAVMGIVNPRRAEGGAHAEYVCVPAASVAALDAAADLADACTIPMNGLTAKMALEALALPSGATLLVTGGAGAVGGYAIALARRAGLRIVAEAKQEDRELLQRLGADEVVPRGDAMAAAVRSLHPGGVHGLLDCALLGDAAAALVHDGGAVISLRRTSAVTDARLRCGYIGVLEQVTNTPALNWLVERWRDGTLKPRVAARFPIDQAAQAHRLLEQGGLRGRVVLLLSLAR